MPISHRIILDTDIGSDVDDLMALALILGSPQLELLGVTTVYGDTRLRAQLAHRVLRLVGHQAQVHAGESTPISGKDVWWAGHEGALYDQLEEETYDSDAAVDFLVEAVLAEPGSVDVVAIGPLTNIARAIEADPRFAASVRHLWVMGGSFSTEEPEHNLRSDDAAARRVFESNIPITVTGLEITRRINVGREAVASIAASGELGKLIQAEIRQWWEFWETEWNVPHDPVTVLTMTHPDLFTLSEPGRIEVGSGEREGISTFKEGVGSIRVTVDLESERVSAAMVEGIVAAGQQDQTSGSAS